MTSIALLTSNKSTSQESQAQTKSITYLFSLSRRAGEAAEVFCMRVIWQRSLCNHPAKLNNNHVTLFLIIG